MNKRQKRKEEWLKNHGYTLNSISIYPTWGKWIDIDEGYELEIDLKNATYRAYSYKEQNTPIDLIILDRLWARVEEDYRTMLKECEE